MYKFKSDDSLLEDLSRTGHYFGIFWPSFPDKEALLISSIIPVSNLPFFPGKCGDCKYIFSFQGYLQFKPVSICLPVLWVWAGQSDQRGTRWTADSTHIKTLRSSQLVFFLPIYSSVFQTKWPSVEAWGLAVKEKAVRLLILAHFSCSTVYICLVTFWSDRNSLRLNKTGVVAAVWMPIYARADRWTQTMSGNSAAALKGQRLFLVRLLKVNSLSNMFCKILIISSAPSPDWGENKTLKSTSEW